MNDRAPDPYVVLPDQRLAAVSVVTRALWKSFRKSTAADLDALAESIVDGLIDPVLQREWDRREAAFHNALSATMGYYRSECADMEARLIRMERDRDRARSALEWSKAHAKSAGESG